MILPSLLELDDDLRVRLCIGETTTYMNRDTITALRLLKHNTKRGKGSFNRTALVHASSLECG